MMSRTIEVEHLARVEGHGKILVEIANGRASNVQLKLVEGPRFFEGLVLGRRAEEVPLLMSRICAICSAGHKLTSIMAIEKALEVQVSRQTELLRELLHHGMYIESHGLHLYFLALPDYLGFTGAVELAPKYPEEVKRGLGIKKLGNTIQGMIGGRPINPENAIVGGFGKVPNSEQLENLREYLERLLPDAEQTVLAFAGLKYNDFAAGPAIFYALRPEGPEYGYFGQTIVSSLGEEIPVEEYRQICNEEVVLHSTAKQSRKDGNSFMVGCLARMNLLADRLTPRAKNLLQKIGWMVPSHNPLHNNLARSIELVYSFERCLAVIDELLANGVSQEPVDVMPRRAGRGVAATEVPRGTLFHEYELDQEGRVVRANVVTPTALNQANIEKDIASCVSHVADKNDEEIERYLEMIARAYDPCISCATHLVEVKHR